jgi:hypothetical protein
MRGYRTKKISLPGGRVIEIVYFSDPGEPDVVDADTTTVQEMLARAGSVDVVTGAEGSVGPASLIVCPSCASDLVYPVSWEESSGTTWTIERRCPNCEWRHSGEFDDEDLTHFDEALNEGTETLLIALRDTTRANMEAAAERFIDAIKLDLIEPMDF